MTTGRIAIIVGSWLLTAISIPCQGRARAKIVAQKITQFLWGPLLDLNTFVSIVFYCCFSGWLFLWLVGLLGGRLAGSLVHFLFALLAKFLVCLRSLFLLLAKFLFLYFHHFPSLFVRDLLTMRSHTAERDLSIEVRLSQG